MNLKTTVPLVVAFVLAVVAAIVANRLISQRPEPVVAEAANLLPSLVAARDIAPGTALKAEDFKEVRTTAEAIPLLAINDLAKLEGRVTRLPVATGQNFVEPLLAPAGAASGLAGLLDDGQRAITIGINAESGVGGFLEPGAKVDIVARLADRSTGQQVTRTIAQQVTILAVGGRLTPGPVEVPPGTPPPPPASNVTILVSPELAEEIDLATASGQTRLVLRSSTDELIAELDGASLDDLARPNADREPVVASTTLPPAPSPFDDHVIPQPQPRREVTVRSVTIIRNGVESVVTLDRDPAASAVEEAETQTEPEPDPAELTSTDAGESGF